MSQKVEVMAKYQSGERQHGILGVVGTIKNWKTADVVEVVRCKNCIHKVDFKGRVMCDRNAKVICGEWCGLTATNDEHFCSYGERKE